MKKLTWLSTLILSFALLFSSCISVGEAPATPEVSTANRFRVAVVTPSAINDLAFSQSMYDALLRVQGQMGTDNFEFVYSENTFAVDDAAAAIRNYASQGYDLIIAHGSQYGSAVQEIAPEFPKTSFAWGTTQDNFGLSNIFAYEAASEEGGYVNGVLAAMLTKSNTLGVIGPIETGDAQLYVEGFKAGVAATKPEVRVRVNYIGSFSDVALASETARNQISAGADILTGTAQMVVGAIDVAKGKDVLWFGTQSNQTSLAPSLVVASQVYHWEIILKEMISLIEMGTLGGKVFKIGLENGGEVIEFNPDYVMPAEARMLADRTIEGIRNGSITVPLP